MFQGKNNSVYNFTEPDLYSALQEPSNQSPMKLNPGSLSLQSLNGFVKRLDSVLSKYETQRSKLLKKNMQIKSHFEQKSLLKSK